jgi:hypothetical protein
MMPMRALVAIALAAAACGDEPRFATMSTGPAEPGVELRLAVVPGPNLQHGLRIFADLMNPTPETLHVAVAPDCPLGVEINLGNTVSGGWSMFCRGSTVDLPPSGTLSIERTLSATELSAFPEGSYIVGAFFSTADALIGGEAGHIRLPLVSPETF